MDILPNNSLMPNDSKRLRMGLRVNCKDKPPYVISNLVITNKGMVKK